METLSVAAAVVCHNGRVLIAQRPKQSHMGLKWEFPGGKVEPGEEIEHCLIREIKEELDLEIEAGRELAVVDHQYEDKKVILHCHWCRYTGGEAKRKECLDFKWVEPCELKYYDFSGADQPVVKLLMEEKIELIGSQVI